MSSVGIENILKRDRVIVAFSLTLITLGAWGYTLYLAQTMDMGGLSTSTSISMEMVMPMNASWSALDFFLMFIMWSVMMVAMMVPSASPMITIFANVNRKRSENNRPFVPTMIFLSGYILLWSLFSVGATVSQWALHEAAVLSPMMRATSPILGGMLLLIAGLFQFTSLKESCLSNCKSPLSFIMTNWKEGKKGALKMGVHHGAYCVGCCWALMALLFVSGVMNILWIAVLSIFILIEKVLPSSNWPWLAWTTGTVLSIWGVFMIVNGFGV
jgi:predicted metal-binding membrane protein